MGEGESWMGYVHGYSSEESQRLQDQANTLAEVLHNDTIFPDNSIILEAGCGVGAQTIFLAEKNPTSRIIAVDISESSLKLAKERIIKTNISNVEFHQSDLYHLNFPDQYFDHIFLCFVLEHVTNPIELLVKLKDKLKPNGTIMVIEGDHESTLFYPPSEKAWKTIQCLIDLQSQSGGNSLIGRQLFPLLQHAGFSQIRVSPRFIYADASRPEWVEGFTRKTYIAMVEGVREKAISDALITPEEWDIGIEDLKKSVGPNGVFCYTFFKAFGTN